ncbi:NYN domain-containing protein [uncultured Thermanaerothrix sp.]|uniref:LabA-like NYN domain-containing protein n=1 Tax=uncultured Thermanaerothrix sp. TaxID=1195149 RepID=UPI00261B1721|nr:NYN domain-containing protein [uncultured Thermanaerothrix sp.]
MSFAKVGVYVDVSNIYLNGGQRLQYDVLREFACRDNAELVRLNAYVSYDRERAERDETYRKGTQNFHSALRDLGYKVIVKEINWFIDENGVRYGKANADLELAVDALLQSVNLDRVLLVSGDGDFVQVVRALQDKGCRVEVIALDNVSSKLRHEADFFISGYLVPNLVPTVSPRNDLPPWGEIGSRVRGWCYWHSDQGYGFMRYLKVIAPNLWLTDTRNPNSPYGSVFFHDSSLPEGVRPSQLPTRNYIFEFELARSERTDSLQALNIELISRL